MEIMAPKLIFLQELWISHCASDRFKNMIPNYHAQIATPDEFSPPEDRLRFKEPIWHGTAVLWHNSLNQYVKGLDNVHHRFTEIRLYLQETAVLAISAYFPTSGKDDEFIACLGELSTFIVNNSSLATLNKDITCTKVA